jgi:hypothetical protein
VIPLQQLVPELLLAVGGALLLGNLAAYLRLRSRWREPEPARPGPPPDDPGPERAPAAGPPEPGSPPSRARVLANMAVGLVVSVAALAALSRTF